MGFPATIRATPPLKRRWPTRRWWPVPLPVSLALHAAVIALLLFAVHRKKFARPAPESSIAVVFQNTGLPHHAAHNAAPPAKTRAQPEMARLPPPPPPPPQPLPRPAPTEPSVNLGMPETLPFARSQEIIPAAPPPPRPETVPHHAPPPRQRFTVINGMSFGHRQTTVLNHAPGALNLAPPQSNLNRQAPDITFKGNAGPDWESAFNKWVNEHDYYPQSAADQGKQGSVTVSFTVLPDGKVTDLRLIRRSGSPLLDMAWYGLFQGVHVPKFPPGSKAKSEKVVATIHYILIH